MNELGPPPWIWRLFGTLAVAITVASIVIGTWLAVTALGRQAGILRISKSNATRLERAEKFNGAIGNAAIASFHQTQCRIQALAELDTEWRRSLNTVFNAFTQGDVAGTRAALPELAASANVDIAAYLAGRCP